MTDQLLITRLRTVATTRNGIPVSVRNLLTSAADEIEDFEQSFEVRWNADMRAIKRWQAAHPGKELVWPDHADLVVWLLEQLP